jgi:hypothetical protein
LNPHAIAGVEYTHDAGPQDLFGALTVCRSTNWCGLWPADLRNICEKWATLKSTDSAICGTRRTG